MSNKPTAIIVHGPRGIDKVLINGDLHVYSVCDATPSDRVYEIEDRATEAEIAEVLRDDPIGHASEEDPPDAE
ncbi:hypothetical protein [Inquilinus limosus]|uniref:Uncharacterized protein n=1 Tax=Inquilinus limosus MP06 TaxID=1398085 RepID=A0A0A0DBN9_9PROT|nr:hypothetical protein [Inquilinus limosus]KGM35313.1 hypothetical protein P409_05215 [Inquilinus limosus MP06]